MFHLIIKGTILNKKIQFLCALLCTWNHIFSVNVTLLEQSKHHNQKNITLTFQLAPDEMILKQTIKVQSDSPHAKLSNLTFSQTPTKQYLAAYKDSKEVFNQTFTITTTATATTNDPTKTNLYVSFMPLPNSKMSEKTFELRWNDESKPSYTVHDENNGAAQKLYNKQQPNKSYIESFQDVVQTTDNRWIRLLFAFLLGLLLSLTPCIYPMIPITIGILHRHGKKSISHNFAGSLCYAVGLSTTFAILGLLAAFAGASFGSLLSQPIFVIILTLFIGYMSLSMIGFVDIPTPSFMQGGAEVNNSRFGPFLSAYLFGLVSGTIASPCVSPGLALLLTIVATMGNIFSGFLLLFAFGIGMSVPLIVIGTFSTSLQMLPQAGEWMVEIKKFLGFIMLAMCFYYLGNILPAYITMWLFVAYLLFAALFYITDAQKSFDDKTKTIKSLIGIILLACTVFVGYRAHNSHSNNHSITKEVGVTWAQNYDIALAKAKEQKKLLLLDFWAQHCTICKAIEKKIFDKHVVAQELEHQIEFVKVDCTSSSNDEVNKLKQQYKVYAQPAILIIDPTNETVVKKWSSEPYNMTPQEFVNQVKNIKA
ncbi:MAG: hypothetical protein CL947_02850 [Epsilonproteobacteria bacterium]|nr:hypothetical protein [Campylobacterota bacterium]|tara:strand:+ start:3956 stop:5734 length:1779 start_codon:yes stop_codon:yes gene_type:complete